jgi:hypothetical protein
MYMYTMYIHPSMHGGMENTSRLNPPCLCRVFDSPILRARWFSTLMVNVSYVPVSLLSVFLIVKCFTASQSHIQMASSMSQDRILATVTSGCRVGEQWSKSSLGGSRLHARPGGHTSACAMLEGDQQRKPGSRDSQRRSLAGASQRRIHTSEPSTNGSSPIRARNPHGERSLIVLC